MKTLVTFIFLIFSGLFALGEAPAVDPHWRAIVYKKKTCGCCGKWEKHLADNGFKVDSRPSDDLQTIKGKYKIPKDLRSCHTAVVGKFVIEGHVPADSIKKLLHENPDDIVGLAVPGMPVGSPGMEGDHVDHYDVISFNSKGEEKVFDHK